ncbi:uncharacterized protein [Penaeus vannamei]|uniref:uncharacterized protein n=1 Tax=Penaeus vannamei TaxID=6689 RepID=UPI00387F5A06
MADALEDRIGTSSSAYGMQISAEKTKLMTNATNNINSTIKINDEKVEDVQSFKYLGAIVTDEGSLPESSKFLYACESWTLTAEKERKIQAMEMRNYRRFLGISYTDRITNEEVRKRIRCAIGPHDELLKTVKQRKLRWYGHITRSSGLSKAILQGTEQGKRRREKPLEKSLEFLKSFFRETFRISKEFL